MESMELKDYAIDKLVRQLSERDLRIIELEYENIRLMEKIKTLEEKPLEPTEIVEE